MRLARGLRSVHSKKPLAGIMQRRYLKAPRNIGFPATASATDPCVTDTGRVTGKVIDRRLTVP
jgi:hypothetical protein